MFFRLLGYYQSFLSMDYMDYMDFKDFCSSIFQFFNYKKDFSILIICFQGGPIVLKFFNLLNGYGTVMFPKWFVSFILGTINPLTIGICAENHWGFRFVVNLEKMITSCVYQSLIPYSKVSYRFSDDFSRWYEGVYAGLEMFFAP